MDVFCVLFEEETVKRKLSFQNVKINSVQTKFVFLKVNT